MQVFFKFPLEFIFSSQLSCFVLTFRCNHYSGSVFLISQGPSLRARNFLVLAIRDDQLVRLLTAHLVHDSHYYYQYHRQVQRDEAHPLPQCEPHRLLFFKVFTNLGTYSPFTLTFRAQSSASSSPPSCCGPSLLCCPPLFTILL